MVEWASVDLQRKHLATSEPQALWNVHELITTTPQFRTLLAPVLDHEIQHGRGSEVCVVGMFADYILM